MRACQLYHFKYYLPMILTKVDQASMFNSVESRSPFLSKKIINFSLDQDTSNFYKLFNKKSFIKKTFKNLIPKEIIGRKKHGFAFHNEKILRENFSDLKTNFFFSWGVNDTSEEYKRETKSNKTCNFFKKLINLTCYYGEGHEFPVNAIEVHLN